jgi:RNA-directed DNA polymerase
VKPGWANYLCLGTVGTAYSDVTAQVRYRLRRWLARKFDLRGPQWLRHSDRYLHETLGLLWLRRLSAPPS